MNPFLEKLLKDAAEKEAKEALESSAESTAKNELTKTAAKKAEAASKNTVGEKFSNPPTFKVGDTQVSPEDFEAVHSAQQGIEAPEKGTVPNFNPDTNTETVQGKAIPEAPESIKAPSVDLDPTQKISDLDNTKPPVPKTLQEKLQFLREGKFGQMLDNPAVQATAGTGAVLGGAATLAPDSLNKKNATQIPSLDSGIDERPQGMKDAEIADQPPGMGESLKLRNGEADSEENEDDSSENDEPMEMDASPTSSSSISNTTPEPVSQMPKSQQLADILGKSTPSPFDYNNVQNKQTLAVLANQLGAAGDVIAGGLTRMGANPQAQALFKEQAAQAGNITKNFQDQIAMQEQDPNSEVSKAVRDRLKKLGINVSDNLSAAQLNKYVEPAVEKERLQQERIKAQQDQKAIQLKYLQQKQDQLNAYKDAAVQQKIDFKDRDEAAKIGKEMNGLSASSRSAIGQSALVKIKAQRLIDIVQDPNSTTQDLSSAAADMNSIISNTTTMTGTRHQEYNNLRTEMSKLISFVTSTPNAPNIPEVKAHIINVAQRMQKISDEVQQRNLATVKAAHSDFFNRRPEVVNGIIDSITGAPSPQSSSLPSEAPKNSGEIRRLDPATGKVAVFDSNKNFLRYE